jgi:hypothetical protein
MSPQHRRISTLTAAVVLACAVAQPAAFAAGTDLRSPDSRDAHRFVVVPPRSAVDLRSPDTVDLAAGRGVVGQPVVSIESPQGGFDWGDAGIGAGGALALVLLGLGAVLMTSHRRRGIKPPRAVAH